MNNFPTTSTKEYCGIEDDEIFDDSTFLANFDNTSFRQKNAENNVNDSGSNSALNVSALCCDEEISGYDKLSGQTWIYPTNYPVRDYQFNIIKASLVKNTLVSLPTGLGKTFIAAVIMYNFYRWYPLGKIVFTAPTRPLVAQQIDACYNIIAIPPDDTIEMTGHMQVNTRKTHWQNKRVFFATPQVIYNDIKSGICPADKIRCLVMDEAHRARGNYAYCQIVATLDELGCKTYRMLALSATPGSKVEDVISVVKSLHIAHLELRTENCIDVAPYSHSRRINTVIVQLGPELSQLRQQYVEILDFYARRLKQFNILPQNLGNLSKGRIVMLYKDYQTRDRSNRHPQHNYIMKDFTLLIALYHGLELLIKHGSRVFLNFFDEHPEKSWIQSDDRLTALLERLRDDLGINPLSLDRSILPDGTVPEIPSNLCFGHPKFDKLKSIMLEHFNNAKQKNQDTKAIVFCEYRESVNLVHCLLLQCRPLIIPQMFVGQGASGKDGKTVVSQKQQLRVMRTFREGGCNTLVATCVAEEGLDVGSVDLILCFDISTRSPVRLVQRCGRTGRERGGQVYILVTEGKEHQTLLDCMRQRDGLNKKVLHSKEVENNLYKMNPRMMPHEFTPECRKMYITVAKKPDEKVDTEKTNKKNQKDLRSMLLSKTAARSSSSSKSCRQELDTNIWITEEEFKSLYPDGYREKRLFKRNVQLWAMSKEKLKAHITNPTEDEGINLSTWLEWQRTPQNTVNIGHSKQTEMLTNILQKCDEKRLEPTPRVLTPVATQPDQPTQNIIFASPLKSKQIKKKQKPTKSPAKKDGDIRALFSATSTKNYAKLVTDLGIPNDGSVPTRIINLLVDLNLDNTDIIKTCYICNYICDCKTLQKTGKFNKEPVLIKFIQEPILPNLDLIDDINVDAIRNCIKSVEDSQTFTDVNHKTVNTKDDKANNSNFELEFDFDALDEINSPKECEQSDKLSEYDKNFDIGNIEDIFAISSPDEAFEKEIANATPTKSVEKDIASISPVKDVENPKDALEFFGLDSIEDIFADSDDSADQNLLKSKPIENTQKTPTKSEVKNIHPILSPSILSGVIRPKDVPTSPILCSQAKKFQLSTKKSSPHSSTPNVTANKKLLLSQSENNNVIVIPDDNDNKISNSIVDTTNKSMFTITQLVDMINKDKSVTNVSNVSANHRSISPILLSQADRKRTPINTTQNTPISINNSKNTSIKRTESLIILDSDSDSDSTQIYELDNNLEASEHLNESIPTNTVSNKRKFDHKDEMTASPYFNKKAKLEFVPEKPQTIQQKVLAAITSNNTKNNFQNNQLNYHVTVSQPNISSLKENENPQITEKLNKSDEDIKPSPIEKLQQFRRKNMALKLKNKFNSIFKKSPKKSPQKISQESLNDFITKDKKSQNILSPVDSNIQSSPDENNISYKRKLLFESSDDDFVKDKSVSPVQVDKFTHRSTTNHKVRKKKRKKHSLLDMEASISDGATDSGDELTDDSAGSIAEFICDDDDVTHADIQAVYLKSVRSPVKQNGFKIPELPHKYNKAEVFSQYVADDDAYEMDSFCVDSHIGLTQANDVSELEIAEMILEKKRKTKRAKFRSPTPNENGDVSVESPLVRRKNKHTKRRIHSDSDDSS